MKRHVQQVLFIPRQPRQSTFHYPMAGEISQGGGIFSKKEKTEEDLYFRQKVLPSPCH